MTQEGGHASILYKRRVHTPCTHAMRLSEGRVRGRVLEECGDVYRYVILMYNVDHCEEGARGDVALAALPGLRVAAVSVSVSVCQCQCQHRCRYHFSGVCQCRA